MTVNAMDTRSSAAHTREQLTPVGDRMERFHPIPLPLQRQQPIESATVLGKPLKTRNICCDGLRRRENPSAMVGGDRRNVSVFEHGMFPVI